VSALVRITLAVCVWVALRMGRRVAWGAGRLARRVQREARRRRVRSPALVVRVDVVDDAGAVLVADLDPDDSCRYPPPCGGCDACLLEQAAYSGLELRERPIATATEAAA
jgi:hypothetical protein